jgi:hypothetical protein
LVPQLNQFEGGAAPIRTAGTLAALVRRFELDYDLPV